MMIKYSGAPSVCGIIILFPVPSARGKKEKRMNKSEYKKLLKIHALIKDLIHDHHLDEVLRDRHTDRLEYEEAFKKSLNGLIQCGNPACQDVFNLRVNKQCPSCGCQWYKLIKDNS